ncbi:MAG: dihydrolipoyl dehydrogenase [Myxococcota bacterium]|nr:dihydrolipoyl dehydrogenase [Myxococcota bacterium]
MTDHQFDLVVIGAGPGGYIGAIRASQLGMKVACVELEPALGGTCLRVGCIPSKALLEASEKFYSAKNSLSKFGVVTGEVSLDLPAMLRHKDQTVATLTRGIAGLFKKNKVSHYQGRGSISGPGQVIVTTNAGEQTTLSTKHILIATGSSVAPLPGVELDGDRIGTSTEALNYPEVPEHLIVIGAGVIGLELGSVWKRLGANVTVLEYLDRILPGMDSEVAKDALKIFKKQGLDFELGTKVTSAKRDGDTCIVECEGKEPIRCDRVLLAVGRSPNTEGLGAETVGLNMDRRGRILVDDHFKTNVEGIYAIGDVIPGPMLAHKAEEEAVACVEMLATGYGHINYDTIPGVVYTEPEIASVGKTEEELKEANIPYKKGSFPFAANGRARAIGKMEGKVKFLAHAETDRILGVHMIGSHVGDLIAEVGVAMEFGASSEDLARCCHAHPTMAEAVKEAALAVDGRTLNL